jgi:S1-C subfamily serine protease
VGPGIPIAILGYPLGVETAMEGSGLEITARSTLGAGTVAKALAAVLQIDAYAGQGSSGSPVFDAAGYVVAVVYGSARDSGGRIVYAVPSERLIPLLPSEAGQLVR